MSQTRRAEDFAELARARGCAEELPPRAERQPRVGEGVVREPVQIGRGPRASVAQRIERTVRKWHAERE